MRTSLTSLGRRLPDVATELTAIADGLDRHDVRAIERARGVADRVLRSLAEETGVPTAESVTNLIDALLEKHAMPHTIAAHLRVLYDRDSTMVGDSARALIAFLEWRVGSRSRMSAMPARPKRSKLPIVLGGAIGAVGLAIAIVLVARGGEPTPAPAGEPMAAIAGATFEMGSTEAELQAALAYCRDVDHRTACVEDLEDQVQEQRRVVTVSAFELDRHEVTVAEFVTWLGQHPQHDRAYPNVRLDPQTKACTAAPGRERLPIAGVTWDEARRYCEAVGKRLPTEAEWELAARGPARRLFPWGEQPPQCDAVVFAREGDRGPCSLGTPGDAAPVGSASGDVTPEGVHDLGGNVSEWTADGGGDRPRCAGPCVDPKVPDGFYRVVRGGHWGSHGSQLRAATRTSLQPEIARTTLGFRCAR